MTKQELIEKGLTAHLRLTCAIFGAHTLHTAAFRAKEIKGTQVYQCGDFVSVENLNDCTLTIYKRVQNNEPYIYDWVEVFGDPNKFCWIVNVRTGEIIE